ncbi:MAG: type II 3-dehydroquinate dehydratase [Alphaproteobacteria bacterium]|nr:type II 3-dehydroquinate dehydratase [Alphaproteobacteria bacterium]
MSSDILILNGPNLNMLGSREPEIYGSQTLDDIGASCMVKAAEKGLGVDFRQSNDEGEIVSWIQQAKASFKGIVINPAAYTHTSIAIYDALLICEIPVIEVHISNIHQREEFRHSSYVSKVAKGVICGFGSYGYTLAIDAMANILSE